VTLGQLTAGTKKVHNFTLTSVNRQTLTNFELTFYVPFNTK